MAAPGEFCSEKCGHWSMCRELLKSSCNIKKNGIGGPLINRDGQVIGINFYMEKYTPFLPINIAIKCFEHFKKNGCVPQPWPWLGLRGVGLNLMGSVREKIKRRFPFVSRGLIIEDVDYRSPAEDAGLFPGDVIIRCGENDVGSLLEVSEIMWDKLGKYVELVVVRARPYQYRKRFLLPPVPPMTYPEIEKIIVGPRHTQR